MLTKTKHKYIQLQLSILFSPQRITFKSRLNDQTIVSAKSRSRTKVG